MKHMTKKTLGVLLAAILSLGFMVPTAMALTVNLTASETTLTMPDGEPVTMWGYSIDSDSPGGDPVAYGTPFGLNGPPVIKAVAGESLTLELTNNLTNPLEPQTSIVIPGQNSTTMTPVFFTGPGGKQRVRSFTHETANSGGLGTYSWTSLKAGTYLIQSGTHPGVQVPMGLYAVLIVDQTLGTTAYTAQPGDIDIDYTSEVVMLFSEVDSLQHQAIAAGTYGTATYPTTMAAGYQADYFLINGRPFSPDQSPIPAGVSGTNILLRFLNAGLRIREPVIQGGTFDLIAEDGNPFTAIGGSLQQYTQYSLDLTAGKTMDALFTSATDGYFSIYDRRLGLVNNMAGSGGMMTFLEVGAPAPTLEVFFDGTGSIQSISLPGGIDSSATPSKLIESFLVGTEVTLRATPDPSSALTGWLVTGGAIVGECADSYGDCVVTMDDNKTVTATFTNYTQATVITPNGGENIPVGSGYTIRWGAPVTDMTFSLAYSFGAGTPWQTIATGVSGNQYVWIVPTGVPSHGDLFIAVTGYDVAGLKTWVDISDTAAMRYANALTGPNGGETWTAGINTITWDSRLIPGIIASIGLWYQTDPTAPWQLITVLQTDSGSFDWDVPAIPTAAEAKVGLIFYDALGEPLYIDNSDSVFTIN